MAIAMTLQDIDVGVTLVWARFKLTFSGNYVTGGDTLDFTFGGQSPVAFFGQNIPSSQAPQQAFAYDPGGTTTYQYFPITQTTAGVALAANACKLKIITAFNTELAAGAYPAGVTGDTVEIQCAFRKMV